MGSQCFVIWNGLRVKQVQTVSLGWIVKPFTASGMWAEMVRFDKDILQVSESEERSASFEYPPLTRSLRSLARSLRSQFQRDIVRRLGESGKKCLENGCFESFRDVITWWGRRFKRGVRRLEGLSGVVVGSVFGETLGAIDGLYGGDSDGERADMFLERLDEWEVRNCGRAKRAELVVEIAKLSLSSSLRLITTVIFIFPARRFAPRCVVRSSQPTIN